MIIWFFIDHFHCLLTEIVHWFVWEHVAAHVKREGVTLCMCTPVASVLWKCTRDLCCQPPGVELLLFKSQTLRPSSIYWGSKEIQMGSCWIWSFLSEPVNNLREVTISDYFINVWTGRDDHICSYWNVFATPKIKLWDFLDMHAIEGRYCASW